MSRLTGRPFEARDLSSAAAMLAARQRRDRSRLPMFTSALENEAVCGTLLEGLAARERVLGAAALRDGQLVGFLFGEAMLFAPDDFAYQFIPPHSVSMPVEGHAVAEGDDATEVYRALYGELAAGWVANGFFVHRAHIVPGDAALQEAWVALGFGRHSTAATRDTGPVANARAAGIEVHRASSEDIEVVTALSNTLLLHHARSPMFWPPLRTPEKAEREFHLGALTDAASPYFIAYRDGRPVGAQTFLKVGFTPPVVEREGNVYLFEGVVQPEARSGGVGSALLEYSMRWARENGLTWCTLHFASGNPSGAPFWLGQGFVPVEYTMERRIDERIAWARG